MYHKMKEGLKKSLRNYIAVADVLKGVTESTTACRVSDDVYHTWQLTLAAMRMSDFVIDSLETPLERKRFIRETGRYLAGDLNTYNYTSSESGEAIYALKFALAGFSLDIRAAFVRNAGVYFRSMELCKQAKSIENYIFYRKLEGQVASNFLSILLPDSMPANQRSNCVRWFRRAGRVANCFDSFSDLGDDFKEREVVVNPSICNRLSLLGAGFNDGIYLLFRGGIRHASPLFNLCVDALQNNLRKKLQL